MTTLEFAKGHGTLNDFVLTVDQDNACPLSAEVVRQICDRRGGVGADGLLRAVRAAQIPQWSDAPDLWFMDYRNADGSVAEMCGNGLRVFALFLREQGLIDTDSVTVATRAGLRKAELLPDGLVRAHLGEVTISEKQTWVEVGSRNFAATSVTVGNPHTVVLWADGESLADLDLTHEPNFDREVFPDGVNIEFVHTVQPGRVKMRVFERGVGETLSCGTGAVACASGWAKASDYSGDSITVEVAGGRLSVQLDTYDATLTGPALIVAHGQLHLD